MASGSKSDWKHELFQAARSSKTKAKVAGLARVNFAQHALLIRTAILAFGENPAATLYVDGLPAEGDLPRPDLIILHPEVGVLVIENKGIPLEAIHSVDNQEFGIDRAGQLSREDPYHQAERVMYALKDLCKARFDIDQALFLRTAAFPRIRRYELESRFEQTMPPETLFADACCDPVEFRAQILAYSNAALRNAMKSEKLSHQAHDAIMTILSGKALFHPARRTRITMNDARLLGVQIQKLELATKEATQEQKDLGRADLRGSHRLFRGVAGSGKSIMLALNAAQTLVLNREDAGTLFEQNRPKRVLVLCFNRSLVPYLRGKIEERFGRIAWDKPTEHELTVRHFESLVRELEEQGPSLRTNLTFDHKEERANQMCQRFDKLPKDARHPLSFDAIYVDEAQDLLPAEIELLRRLARPDEENGQTLILFYDNAQNIYGVTPPTWEKLGVNIVGRTVFLDTCLRNSREVLKFAFNVLVGTFAPEGQRVSTRKFADVTSLRDRGLIAERDGVFEVLFSPRNGPVPRVQAFNSRADEIDGLVTELKRLFGKESVLPSDVLILYNSPNVFRHAFVEKIERIMPAGYQIRQVDKAHQANKNLPLMEEGILTISTIASAKGYDAPVVFLLGADELATDPPGRATFYVGATRAKLALYVTGVSGDNAGLLPEILEAAKHAGAAVASPSGINPIEDDASEFQDLAISAKSNVVQRNKCQHCGGEKLHCQQGGSGYYFVCIGCTKTTNVSRKCNKCGAVARVRARQQNFVRICKACDTREIVHTNVSLDLIEG